MDSAGQVIHQLFTDILGAWLEDRGPAEAMEATTPAFASQFGQDAAEFTFEQFRHVEAAPDWSWQVVELSDGVEGTLLAYRPEAWTELRQHGPGFQLLTAEGRPRQSSGLAEMDWWASSMPAFLGSVQVVGFDFAPVHPGYGRWVFVIESDGGYWCWGIYRAVEWVVVMKGDATGPDELTEQLQSLMNGDPWGWWQGHPG